MLLGPPIGNQDSETTFEWPNQKFFDRMKDLLLPINGIRLLFCPYLNSVTLYFSNGTTTETLCMPESREKYQPEQKNWDPAVQKIKTVRACTNQHGFIAGLQLIDTKGIDIVNIIAGQNGDQLTWQVSTIPDGKEIVGMYGSTQNFIDPTCMGKFNFILRNSTRN